MWQKTKKSQIKKLKKKKTKMKNNKPIQPNNQFKKPPKTT